MVLLITCTYLYNYFYEIWNFCHFLIWNTSEQYEISVFYHYFYNLVLPFLRPNPTPVHEICFYFEKNKLVSSFRNPIRLYFPQFWISLKSNDCQVPQSCDVSKNRKKMQFASRLSDVRKGKSTFTLTPNHITIWFIRLWTHTRLWLWCTAAK